MPTDRRTFVAGGLGMAAMSAASAPAAGGRLPVYPSAERFPLWPGSPPGRRQQEVAPNQGNEGELRIRGVPMPELHPFRPAQPDGSALLVIPGGGYGFLSVENEGTNPAARFNREGVTVFVLTHRLPVDGWSSRSLVPLQDAQRAMRLIRSRAAEFRIESNRLGVLGFSAGGHLAADLTVAHSEQTYAPVDGADALPARPSFTGLLYPVVGMEPRMTRGSSRRNLLGPRPSRQVEIARSPVRHVKTSTPPCFIAHAFDDDLVPVENSLRWIDACRSARVPVEAHLFERGGHGFGLNLPPENPGSRWPDLFAQWVRFHARVAGSR